MVETGVTTATIPPKQWVANFDTDRFEGYRRPRGKPKSEPEWSSDIRPSSDDPLDAVTVFWPDGFQYSPPSVLNDDLTRRSEGKTALAHRNERCDGKADCESRQSSEGTQHCQRMQTGPRWRGAVEAAVIRTNYKEDALKDVQEQKKHMILTATAVASTTVSHWVCPARNLMYVA